MLLRPRARGSQRLLFWGELSRLRGVGVARVQPLYVGGLPLVLGRITGRHLSMSESRWLLHLSGLVPPLQGLEVVDGLERCVWAAVQLFMAGGLHREPLAKLMHHSLGRAGCGRVEGLMGLMGLCIGGGELGGGLELVLHLQLLLLLLEGRVL